MIRKLTYLLVVIVFTDCTLIPSNEYFKSDNLDPAIAAKQIEGTFKLTNESLKELENYYSNNEMGKLKSSVIKIYAKGDSIKTFYMPTNDPETGFSLSTSTDQLNIRKGHEKFWHLGRKNQYWPDIKFRLRNGVPSLLVNLSTDPDGFDYYEYKKE